MFSSVIESQNNIKHIKITSLAYAATTFALLMFYNVYMHFNYGQSSDCMKYMYLVTLIGGLIAISFLLVCHRYNYRPRTSFNMWNSGIALIVSGLLIESVVSLSGRYTKWGKFYFAIGLVLIVLAAIIALIRLSLIKRCSRKNS